MRELYSSVQIDQAIEDIANSIMKKYNPDDEIVVISLLKGSFIFTADLIRKINRNILLDFMIVSSYGDSLESTNNVVIKQDITLNIENKKVIIIDDIIDTGNTLYEIKKHIETKNPDTIECCCLFNKNERRQINVDVEYIGFNCPNEFVIGYGMDASNKYRNLPYIGSFMN